MLEISSRSGRDAAESRGQLATLAGGKEGQGRGQDAWVLTLAEAQGPLACDGRTCGSNSLTKSGIS